jgi:hypothetical protein
MGLYRSCSSLGIPLLPIYLNISYLTCRIKVSVLERIHQEPEKKVKTVIVQAAGQIALMEPDNWPELFRLIEETISCEGVPEMREVCDSYFVLLEFLVRFNINSFIISVGPVRH